MAEILQGTTPSLEIKISTEDFMVTDVYKLEWTIKYTDVITIYSLNDVVVDAENNSFMYTFSEAETLAMKPLKPLKCQLRFMFEDGSIVGTEQIVLQVRDLISEEVMST